MTNWNLLFRRMHLYLGMLLIPWVMIYALSTVLFNHHGWFEKFRATEPQWLPLWEKDCALDVPPGNDRLRDTAQRILSENGLSGAFGVQRQGQRLTINVQNFWQPKRLTYDLEKKKLRAEQKKFAWPELLTRLHFRTGYGQPGFLNNLWAVIVDVFCVTMLVWIGTGLYLWWKLAMTRTWGFITIGAGAASILLLLFTL
ncbi:MAG: PepSY-associated TM helix domain-containing protein [Verrucomicrobia bacterium]|nr:PepSY-associated TM helix domain-containing protein [Verrucomicrobiota bacterium]